MKSHEVLAYFLDNILQDKIVEFEKPMDFEYKGKEYSIILTRG